MLSSCGEPFGTTCTSTALPFGLGMTGLTCATSGVCSIAAATFCIAATSPGDRTSLATSNGPLKPGPEALAQQVVGAAGRELGRVVARVGDAEPQPERREREHDQEHEAADRDRPRVPLATCGSSAPRWSAPAGFASSPSGSDHLSIVWPTKPSTAGSSVTAARHHEQHRERRRRSTSPRMNDTPITNRPSSEMTTVPPANSTARPLVSIACTTAASGSTPSCKRLSIAGADEQRVVDTDTDPDHRGDLRRERRNVEHARKQRDDREPDPDAEQRGHDRQAHREHRTERDQQDDDRGQRCRSNSLLGCV